MAKKKGVSKNLTRHRHPQALLIIDMLNTLEFPEGRQLLRFALPAARKIAALKMRMKKKGVPVIYVNDNFGHWQSDKNSVYEICSAVGSRGRGMAELLKPEADDYFVLKPRHSGFYSTTLNVLLQELGTKELWLTGVAGNICVLLTAYEAHMRDFKVTVVRDAVASNTKRDNDFAFRQMKDVLSVTMK